MDIVYYSYHEFQAVIIVWGVQLEHLVEFNTPFWWYIVLLPGDLDYQVFCPWFFKQRG